MKKRYILLALLFVGGFNNQEADAYAEKIYVVANVRVLENPLRPQFVSGGAMSWVRLAVRHGRRNKVFFVPYMEADQVLPAVGSMCRLRYHVATLPVMNRNLQLRREQRRIVEGLRCRGPGSQNRIDWPKP
jgi:hypothetical protein